MRALIVAAGLLLAGPPLDAQPALAKIDYTAERASIGRYQDADQRLQDVGWQLALGNAAFCSKVVPSIGLQLQDMASYGAPTIARAALGLKRDFAVQTAARGSPAAVAGGFTRNREVSALGPMDPNTVPAGAAMDWQRLVTVHDHIDTELRQHGLSRGHPVPHAHPYPAGDRGEAERNREQDGERRFVAEVQGERDSADLDGGNGGASARGTHQP